MTQSDQSALQIAALQDRLTRLSEASLHINQGLELDAVLQRVLDSARSLTGAHYGVMTTLDETGQIEDFLASGFTPEDAQQLWQMPGARELFEYVNSIPAPWRVADFAAHASTMGWPDFRPPIPLIPFLTAPMWHRNDRVGNIYMAKGEPGPEFTGEDEETLAMFAAQASLVIANARRYRDEQQARVALETLVETSPVGVGVFDARTGALVSFNREAARIADSLGERGQSPEQLLGTLTCRRADGRETSLLEWPLAEALNAGETVRAEEIVLSVPDGRSVAVLLNATPIRTEHGNLKSFVITLQDMTPLAEMERLRAEFLGMVGHELRTPLTSIRGSATTLLDIAESLDPAELRQFLRIIVDQADNMRDLIGDLLDVARIETGALSISAEPAEVITLVDRARNTFLSGGGRNNLDINLAPDLPLVMADRRRLVQVIGNLLSNAARHSPNTTAIRVSAVREDAHVAISVSDEGRGIPSEQLPRLFRKFSRSSPDDQGSDFGLGLAICKGIVEAHGGRIWAESAGPGLGARFTFTLPTIEDVLAERTSPVSQPQSTLRGGMPVLVVDDDPHTLLYVRNTLSDAGYNPIVTGDPEEAPRLMVEHRPNLVLLDMVLPGYDGIDLMRDLSGISNVPVVFLSAYGGDQVIARALETGAADYIVKPFSPTELVARVGTALRRWDAPYRAEPAEPYTFGDLTIDYTLRNVTLAGVQLQLTAMEYDLLHALSVSGGRVLTHERLLRQVWGPSKTGDVQGLRTLMRRLRVKLGESGASPTYISAISRVGYRMPESQSAPEE